MEKLEEKEICEVCKKEFENYEGVHASSIYDEVLNNYFKHDMAIIGRWIEMLLHQLLFNMLAPILDVICITMQQGFMVYAGDIKVCGNTAYLIMELEDISYGKSTITNTHMGANAGLSPDNYPY